LADNFNRQIGDLQRLIAHNYDRQDMGRLCTTMGAEFERLPGETKLQKVNSLLTQCVQNGQLAGLVKELGEYRPQVAWPPIPASQLINRNSINSENEKGELKSALQKYLDDIKQKLLDARLHEKSAGDEALVQASALVRDCFSRLDLARRRSLLEFLHENSFIERSSPLLALNDADLSNTDLSWITLNNTVLRYVNLSGADLSLANLGGVDLSGSILRGARLKAYLVGAKLIKSDLREADLSGAHLAHASLAGANLRFANLQRADLRGANLTGADLRYANFQEANLSGVNFSFTTLSQVNLREAVMKGAIFHQTDFRNSQAP
jgi:uncharacterized protein YjbI with pentapeptide repeats